MIKFIIFIALTLSSSLNLYAKKSVHLLNIENNKPIQNQRFLSNDVNIESDDGLPSLDKKYLSESGRFEFNYTLTGVDAISDKDDNSNGVPDFIDSAEYYFEYVYDIYINQLGFRSPLKLDYDEDGDPYQIHFQELGDYFDFTFEGEAYTSPGGAYGYTLPRDKILPPRKFERYYSGIFIDNNFSEYDSVLVGQNQKYRTFYTFGMDALKVTIAHEFNHAIHLIYGLDNPYSREFYEMHSVLMEDYVFPDINDYVQYVQALFSNLTSDYSKISSLTPNAGYRYSIFLMMLNNKYGIGFATRVMELTYDGYSNFIALDMAIKEENPQSSLRDEWCELKDWIYYSGQGKMINPEKTFDDYKLYGKLKFLKDNVFDPPVFMHSASIDNFEINNIRLFFKKESTISDDTLDVMITNLNTSKLFDYIETKNEYLLNVADYQANSNMQFLDPVQMYYNIEQENDICYSVYTSTGEQTQSLSYSFPNPVNLNNDDVFYLPVPDQSALYQKVIFVIYDMEMHTVMSDKLEIIPYEGKRVIKIDDLSKFSAGVYVFAVHYFDDILLGKIAVVRK